jgi:hypothetical protein
VAAASHQSLGGDAVRTLNQILYFRLAITTLSAIMPAALNAHLFVDGGPAAALLLVDRDADQNNPNRGCCPVVAVTQLQCEPGLGLWRGSSG